MPTCTFSGTSFKQIMIFIKKLKKNIIYVFLNSISGPWGSPGFLKRGVKRREMCGGCRGQRPPALELFFKFALKLWVLRVKSSTDTIHGKL